jgi:hypothetical protein
MRRGILVERRCRVYPKRSRVDEGTLTLLNCSLDTRVSILASTGSCRRPTRSALHSPVSNIWSGKNKPRNLATTLWRFTSEMSW